jgi:hypothetical protein
VFLSSRIAKQEKHTPSADALIARMAARQHGIVRLDQLMDAGLSRAGITRRVAAGRLVRVHTGVYAVGHGALARDALFFAAVAGAGPGAALSHASATEHHGVWRHPGPYLIAVVSPTQRRPAGVKVHRARRLDPRDLTTHRNIRVTTVHRAIVDLADELIALELTHVIREAAFLGRFVEPAVRDAMERVSGRHKLDVVDRAIEHYRAGSAGLRSRYEKAFFLLVTNAGFPEPLVNVHAHGFERDFHWPELALAVELDGPDHTRPRSRADDEARDASWRAAGYTALRFSNADVVERPADVLTRLRTQAPHGPAR